jgi:hypothetical protein
MAKLSKIEKAKQDWDKAKELSVLAIKEYNKIGSEVHELNTKMHDPSISDGEILVILKRLRDLKSLMNRARDDYKQQCIVARNFEIEFHNMERRLQNAHRTLEVIANPPPWGLGNDYTRDDIAHGKQRAQETIRELEK